MNFENTLYFYYIYQYFIYILSAVFQRQDLKFLFRLIILIYNRASIFHF